MRSPVLCHDFLNAAGDAADADADEHTLEDEKEGGQLGGEEDAF